MKLGIVGAEAAKFTLKGEERAKEAIYSLLTPEVTHVVSGHCYLGGVDIWAEQCGQATQKELEIYPPRELNWANGYKPRNLQIAHNSDKVVCIVVDTLPPGFKGMIFDTCYHCKRAGRPHDHIKSGGCWTVLQAIKIGKDAEWIVIKN